MATLHIPPTHSHRDLLRADRDGSLKGYRSQRDGDPLERDEASRATCPECGAGGMGYRSFHDRQTGQRRAFFVCTADSCDASIQI